MKKILVLIDDLEEASKIIDVTIKQCETKREIIVLAYVTPPKIKLIIEGFRLVVSDTSGDILRRQIEQSQLSKWKFYLVSKGFSVLTIRIDGTRISNLLEILKNDDFDLLIMNAKGRNWLRDKLISSPWGTLINELKIPLFIIPNNYNTTLVSQ